jgi:hypothetical protein
MGRTFYRDVGMLHEQDGKEEEEEEDTLEMFENSRYGVDVLCSTNQSPDESI